MAADVAYYVIIGVVAGGRISDALAHGETVAPPTAPVGKAGR